jgi:hypothetical protein
MWGNVVEDVKLNTYGEKNIDSGDDCLCRLEGHLEPEV